MGGVHVFLMAQVNISISVEEVRNVIRTHPEILTKDDVRAIIENNPDIIKEFIANTKNKTYLKHLCESSISRLRQIYCGEVREWQEKEITSIFGETKSSEGWIKNCRTRHLKAGSRARQLLALHKQFKLFKLI
jgi:hypothetical protein